MLNQNECGWKNWSCKYLIYEHNYCPHCAELTELHIQNIIRENRKTVPSIHQSDAELLPYTQTYAVFPCTQKPSALLLA